MKILRCEIENKGTYAEHFQMGNNWKEKVRNWVEKIDPQKGSKLKMYVSESVNNCFVYSSTSPDKIITI